MSSTQLIIGIFFISFFSSFCFCTETRVLSDPELLGTWNGGGNTITFTDSGFNGVISGLQCSGTYLVNINKSPCWIDLLVVIPFALRIEAIYLHELTGPGDRQLILQLPLNINLALGIGLRPLSITVGAYLFTRVSVALTVGDSWLLGKYRCNNDGISLITFFSDGRFELSLSGLILVGTFIVDLRKSPYWLDLHCLLPGDVRFLIPAIYQHSFVGGVKTLVLELPPFNKISACLPLGGVLIRPVAFLTRTLFVLLDLLLREEQNEKMFVVGLDQKQDFPQLS